ncbi:MAG: hypothetical protein NTY33_00235 [Candidatus Moranbacteria bacterium]|nr:hypothetical protein [Candidatus Moranbacteria bacterium]
MENKVQKSLIIIFCLWFLALMATGLVSSKFSTYNDGGKVCAVKKQLPFYRWDSFWYTSISRHGYSFSLEKNSSIAFFPAYPAVIKLVHTVSGAKEDQISLVLNILFSALIVFFLYRLALMDYSDVVSRNIVLVWLLFPPAYFLLSGYPEAMFVFLAVLSFYLARKKAWLWAGIVAGILAVTKPYGVFMLPALFVEYFESNAWDWRVFYRKFTWLPLLLPLVTFGGFVLFNFLKFGNALAFLSAQHTWGRTLGSPLSALFSEFKFYLIDNPIMTGSNFPYLIYLFSFVFSIFAFALSWKKIRNSYLVFSGLLLLSAFLTGTLTSWGRYMFLGFPILMGPAIYLSRKKWLLWIYLFFSALVLLFCASFFARCYPFE